MKINVIIPAGGTSSRFGKSNKLTELIDDKMVIEHTVDAFCIDEIDEIIIPAHESIIELLTDKFKLNPKIKIIKGGDCRQKSVFNGLEFSECDYVLIHDGARPMITKELVRLVIDTVQDKKALTVATKTIDTIKEVENGKIIRTIDRSKLYNTQTPQAFDYNLILNAHKKLAGENFTDDAGMLEKLRCDVYIIDGSYKNLKITTKADLDAAKIYLSK